MPRAVDDAPTSLDLDDVAPTGVRTRRRQKRSALRNAIEWVVVIVGAVIVAVVVKTFLVQAFYIPSASMVPTLAENDRVLVNKISYDLGDVERGDIVVFHRPDTWPADQIEDLIKRVIALPGERVSTEDGHVLIDGEPLEEPWLLATVRTDPFLDTSGCGGPDGCVVPEGELFVLGDNRGNSAASNYYGPIPFEEVVGRAFLRVWPLGSFGGL